MSKAKQRQKERNDIASQNFREGLERVKNHPLFYPLTQAAYVLRDEDRVSPEDGLAYVTRDGYIICNPKRRAEPEQWARALAHCLLHLGMGHFQEKKQPVLWNMACDCAVEKFLSDLKFGAALSDVHLPTGINDEERLYQKNP